MTSEQRKADGPQQGEAIRDWAHRVLDDLLDDIARRDFFGVGQRARGSERGARSSHGA